MSIVDVWNKTFGTLTGNKTVETTFSVLILKCKRAKRGFFFLWKYFNCYDTLQNSSEKSNRNFLFWTLASLLLACFLRPYLVRSWLFLNILFLPRFFYENTNIYRVSQNIFILISQIYRHIFNCFNSPIWKAKLNPNLRKSLFLLTDTFDNSIVS